MTACENPSASRYRGKHACRCDACREAHRLRSVVERAARFHNGPDRTAPHNAVTYQQWGCRCGFCRKANTAQGRTRRLALSVPAPEGEVRDAR